jgi:ankyrin repeat protein
VNLKQLFREAVDRGMLPVVKYLIEAGVNPRIDDERALKIASVNGDIDIVRYLVDIRGCSMHTKDHALRLAAEYGRLDLVKYLVSVGAHVGICRGVTLAYTMMQGHHEVANFLHKEIAKLENSAKVL